MAVKKQFPIGLCSVSFRKQRPEEILKAMAAAEIGLIEWGSDVHAPVEKAEEIASLQKRYGIRCCSYGTYFDIGVNRAKELTDYIRAAKLLGTNILRLWARRKKDSEEYTEEEKQLFFAECRRLAAIAEREEVVLCMECHNKTFTDRYESALALMQAVDSPCFRMYWQPNQFRSEEENLLAAKALSPYTVNLHVFNWKGKEKYPLREGAEIWNRYLSCFDGTQTLLLEFMPDGRIESLSQETDAIRCIKEEIL